MHGCHGTITFITAALLGLLAACSADDGQVDLAPGSALAAAAVAAPARIQAESYQRAYEKTPGNAGGQCDRGDGVDMERTTDPDGGACNVGWTDPGEWLEYDVQTAARRYDIGLRLASDAPGRGVRVLLDGVDLGAQASPSGGWQAWQSRVYARVQLAAGNHVLRVVFETGLVNLDYLDVKASAGRDVTFFAVADTHADPPESYDLRATARAINAVAAGGSWPANIGGKATGFVGGPIAAPVGVVFLGDITGWGTAPTEIARFQSYFEPGRSGQAIGYPAYVGLGNHDLDSADWPEPLASQYRAAFWAYVDGRHRGAGAPTPVTRFDAASHAYAWDAGGVHFVQTHRFPGDSHYGLASSLGFLASDLHDHAADGRPVFVFHHYGMDAFGTEDRWWTAAERAAYRSVLRGYHVAAIFAGHSHAAMQYEWQGLRVFHANNAKAEIDTGNRDGKGSFAIVRVTDSRLDVVTCRWLDDAGHYELVAPFYSGPIDRGPAP